MSSAHFYIEPEQLTQALNALQKHKLNTTRINLTYIHLICIQLLNITYSYIVAITYASCLKNFLDLINENLASYQFHLEFKGCYKFNNTFLHI